MVLTLTAVGCGSATHTAAPETTGTTIESVALARFCADLDAPVPPMAMGAGGSTMTAESLRNQFAAGLPHWERLLDDAPPPAAANIAPVVAAIHQVVALDPTMSLTDTSAAASAIMNAPDLKAALIALGEYAAPLCRPGAESSTTATD